MKNANVGIRNLGAAAAALLLCIAGDVGAAGLNAGPWPMFHRNASHEGRTFEAYPATPSVAWTAVGDSIEFSSPVMAFDGTIYIGDTGKDLEAYYPSGGLKWSYHTGGNIRYSTPAIAADGAIYVGSADGRLYAINPNGTLRWSFLTGGAVKTSPAIAPDGTIYFGSDDRKLWALNANGTVKWSFATADTVRSSPALAPDGTILFGSNDGNIYAVFPNGLLRWQATTGGPVKASPAIGQGGDVIVGSYDGFLYAITYLGSFDWAAYVNNPVRSSAAIGIHGKIYIGLDTDIVCFHDRGDTSWVYPTGGRIYSAPAVRTNLADSVEVAFCGSDDGKLYAIRQGNLVWEASLGSAVRSSPMVANGHVYTGVLDGRLVSIGAPPTSVDESVGTGLRLLVGPNPLTSGRELSIRLSGDASQFGDAVDSEDARRAGTLSIHDPAGRQIRSLGLAPSDQFRWDGRDATGHELPSGVYLVRWNDGARTTSARAVLLR